MIVKRWLVKEVFDPDAPICEIEVDGVSRVLDGRPSQLRRERDFGMIRSFYVAEGNEIGPSGNLFEFTSTSPTPDSPRATGAPLHASAKLKLTRRDQYPHVFLTTAATMGTRTRADYTRCWCRSSEKMKCFLRNSVSGQVKCGIGQSSKQ